MMSAGHSGPFKLLLIFTLAPFSRSEVMLLGEYNMVAVLP